MITFRYKEEPLGNGKSILRPVADVYLKRGINDWIEFHPYIDSGADVTMIPLSLGKLIGFTVNHNRIEQIGGIRGSVSIIYKKHPLKIGEQVFNATIAWALTEDVPALLGRTDVFDLFRVTFKQKQKLIEFM